MPQPNGWNQQYSTPPQEDLPKDRALSTESNAKAAMESVRSAIDALLEQEKEYKSRQAEAEQQENGTKLTAKKQQQISEEAYEQALKAFKHL